MEFDASHRFSRSLDEVAAALVDPAAHVRRYELAGGRDIRILHADQGDGALELKTVRTVEGDVPALAQKIVASTNTVTTTERWERTPAGAVHGTALVEAGNVPGTATLTAVIEPDGPDSCTYDLKLALALKIPLIGDRFTKLLRPQVMEIIDAEFEAWDRYLAASDEADHGAS